jgi:hypothetical protein
MLLVDSVVVFKPSGSGTPAFTIAPRMRQKRSRTAYSMMPLMTGILRSSLSFGALPFGLEQPEHRAEHDAKNVSGMYHMHGEQVGDAEQHAGRQWQVGVELFEQRLELRQHVAGEHGDREQGQHHDDARVGQRAEITFDRVSSSRSR